MAKAAKNLTLVQDQEPEQTVPETPEYDDEEQLWLIPQIALVMRWIEELITALSGYGVVFALAVGVVDILTEGKLTTDNPNIDYAYAIAMAVGIAGQIVGIAARSSRAWSKGDRFLAIWYGILVAVLAYVEYVAGIVFGFHKTFGVTVPQALGNLGITESNFIQVRTGVAVGLAVISGYLRNQGRKKRKTQAQKLQEIKEKQELRAAQQGATAGFLAGIVQTGKGAVDAARTSTAGNETGAAPTPSKTPVLAKGAPRAGAFQGQRKATGEQYTEEDPRLALYVLPAPYELDTWDPITIMADALGVIGGAAKLSTLWNQLDLPWEGPFEGQQQASNTKNIQVWQVLALADQGELELSKIDKLATVSV